MNNGNYTRAGIFLTFVYLLTNDMTSKFIAGVITGIFVSTKYDFKPYVSLIEDKISSLQKELETKRDEINHKESSQTSWAFNWPWSDVQKKN
jgi:hypothetical protein